MPNDFVQEFIAQSVFRIEENTPRIIKCLDQLTEEQVWQKPNGSLNSIANLILHLCGNITQYIISSLGDAPDNRMRDVEFSQEGGLTKAELQQRLTETIGKAVSIIKNTPTERYLVTHEVQGFALTGIGIVIHVTEHYSYHTGQIAFWTKMLLNRDLGFYAGIDLNVKNIST